ncbi:hypothetical protein VB264_17670 [Arcicella aquatica]|uniref:HNH endonuclease n=1 Tax=Arcicella aquatica TaxID=217141 RepID=A0ABU5QSB4_9BACT|nr:hypothetical protein [Arcicella aquatica]MEA5259629.1 hypothetical protein [Arcicella aquatica]
MAQNKVEGICGICGQFGQLTFEHVPPKAAFNKGKFVIIPSEKSIQLGLNEEFKGPVFQGGIGLHSLCAKCNNATGRWYGNDYVRFAYQAALILQRSKFKPTLFYPFHLSPIKVLKQVVSMFLSINHDVPFREDHPELVKFVLDRNDKYLNPKYRICMYYNYEGINRYLPFTVVMNVEGISKPVQMCEISYPPFGFVFTFDSSPLLDEKLFDISFFSRYDFNYSTRCFLLNIDNEIVVFESTE